jgi:hypothetical protein
VQVQVAECLLCKWEALNSNPNLIKERKKPAMQIVALSCLGDDSMYTARTGMSFKTFVIHI